MYLNAYWKGRVRIFRGFVDTCKISSEVFDYGPIFHPTEFPLEEGL